MPRPVRWALAALALAAGLLALVGALVVGDTGPGPVGAGLGRLLAAARPAAEPFAGLSEARLAVGDDCLRVVVADDEAEQVRGLMEVTDLGPYDGMLFVFGDDIEGHFHMRNTPVPLDIGFYRRDGSPIEHLAMVPCPDDVPSCPTYGPAERFRFALETLAGELGPGALGPCG